MKISFLFAGLLAFGALARAEFSPSLQLDRRARYENQQVTSNSTWGQSTDLYFIPAFAWGANAILPVIVDLEQGRGGDSDGSSSGNSLVTNETYFVRRTTYLFKPIYRRQWDKRTGLKLWGTAKRTVNAEKDDTVPYKGLYDYEEFGVGTGFDRKGDGAVASWGAGLEYQHRHYPNWKDPGTPVTDGKNYYTKDYNALKVNLNVVGNPQGRLPWTLALSWLGRGYTDSYLYDTASDGSVLGSVTPSKSPLRAESLLRVGGDVRYAFNEAWSLLSDLGVDYNASNFNYFDTVAFVGYSDYYGYHSTHGSLGLSWRKAQDGPGVVLKAELTNRVYTGRPIRNPDGSYTEGKQADLEQVYSLDFDAPLGKGFALVGGMNWTNVLSNQGFPLPRPSYDLFSSSLGLRYKL
jgi:hypothetical protein